MEIPELNVIGVSIDPSPTGGLTPQEVQMVQMIMEHKSVQTGAESPEEAERLLAQLPKRGLFFWHDIRCAYLPDPARRLPWC